MKRNYNIIKISGFKGILFAVFVVGCLIAGFLTFPSWVCMHIWNYISGFISGMPQMTLLHGAILWCIIALSIYALNQGNFSISFGGVSQVPPNEARIKEILNQIHERNSNLANIDKVLNSEIEKVISDESNSDDKVENQ